MESSQAVKHDSTGQMWEEEADVVCYSLEPLAEYSAECGGLSRDTKQVLKIWKGPFNYSPLEAFASKSNCKIQFQQLHGFLELCWEFTEGYNCRSPEILPAHLWLQGSVMLIFISSSPLRDYRLQYSDIIKSNCL